MTVTQLQQREERSAGLRVFPVAPGDYYVESSKGKVCYRVMLDNGTSSCTCGDYNSNIQKDKDFLCKHMAAALKYSDTRPKLDERFIKNIKGKDFVLYAGVLDLAHKMGLAELKAVPVQYPAKENDMRAICISYARTSDGKVFEDVGDADPKNTDSVISKHIIRMAATRAKARVLRDMTNVGMACLEELADFDEVETPRKETAPEKSNVRLIRKPKEEKDAASKKTDTQNPEKDQEKKEEPSKQEQSPAKQQEPQKTEQPQGQTDNVVKIAPAQMQAIINLAKRRGMTEEDIRARVSEKYNVTFEDMDSADAKGLIRQLQQSA